MTEDLLQVRQEWIERANREHSRYDLVDLGSRWSRIGGRWSPTADEVAHQGETDAEEVAAPASSYTQALMGRVPGDTELLLPEPAALTARNPADLARLRQRGERRERLAPIVYTASRSSPQFAWEWMEKEWNESDRGNPFEGLPLPGSAYIIAKAYRGQDQMQVQPLRPFHFGADHPHFGGETVWCRPAGVTIARMGRTRYLPATVAQMDAQAPLPKVTSQHDIRMEMGVVDGISAIEAAHESARSRPDLHEVGGPEGPTFWSERDLAKLVWLPPARRDPRPTPAPPYGVTDRTCSWPDCTTVLPPSSRAATCSARCRQRLSRAARRAGVRVIGADGERDSEGRLVLPRCAFPEFPGELWEPADQRRPWKPEVGPVRRVDTDWGLVRAANRLLRGEADDTVWPSCPWSSEDEQRCSFEEAMGRVAAAGSV